MRKWRGRVLSLVKKKDNILNFSWNDGVLTLLRGGWFFRKTAFFTHFDRLQNVHTVPNALYIDCGRSDRSSEHTLHIWYSFRRAIGHPQNKPWGGVVFSSFFAIWPVFQLLFSFAWRAIRWMLPLHMETTHVPLSNFATLATYSGH